MINKTGNGSVSLRDYMHLGLEALKAQIIEMDRRYNDRFVAMEKLTAARDESSQKAVQVAMTSADKANDKVAATTEKRIGSLGQVGAAIAATVMVLSGLFAFLSYANKHIQ